MLLHQSGRFSITPEEYQAIPPTLQRKCFSTLERLRYAEAQARTSLDVPTKSSHLDKVNLRPTNINHPSISKLRDSIKSLSLHHSTSDHLLPPGSAYTIANVTQEDALWFSKLPDKVKRGYFSLAEERLLSIETNSNIVDKDPRKIVESSNDCLPSLGTSTYGPPSPVTFHSFEADDMEIDSLRSFRSTNTDHINMDDYHKMLAQTRARLYPTRRSSSAYSLQTSIFMSEGSTIESEGVATPSTEESHMLPITNLPAKDMLDEWGSGWAPMPSKTSRKIKSTKLQTIHSRESSVLLPQPVKNGRPLIGPRSSSTRTGQCFDSSPAPAPQIHRCATNKPSPYTRTASKNTTQAVDSPAAYYLDPEARLKLRMYLASASKFDEVVEFGFPSLPNQENVASGEHHDGLMDSNRPRTVSEIEAGPHGPTFHTNDKLKRSSTAHGPSASITSSDIYSIPYQSLSDQDPILSRDPRVRIQAQLRKLDRDPFGSNTEREMTIRMTLTRPDLRADESVLYSEAQNPSGVDSHTSKTNHLRIEPLRAIVNQSNFEGQRTFSLKRFLKRV